MNSLIQEYVQTGKSLHSQYQIYKAEKPMCCYLYELLGITFQAVDYKLSFRVAERRPNFHEDKLAHALLSS